jgi:hypothetical protein
MAKLAVVQSVVFNRTYPGKNGKMYVFNITMDNGDSGEFTSTLNPQKSFVQGESVKYELTNETGTKRTGEPFTYNKIVLVKEPYAPYKANEMSPEEQDRIKRSVFLRASSHFVAIWLLDKKEVMKTLEALYASMALDKGARISFHGVINTIAEECLFHTKPAAGEMTIKDLNAKIIAYFNYVMGIKKDGAAQS